MFLAGPTSRTGPWRRGQRKHVYRSSRLGGLAQVNNPELKKQRKKRDLFTDTTTKAPITTVCHGLPASSETCMNGSSESRKEATDRKMEVLSAKTEVMIGFWNICTMCGSVVD